MYQKERSIVISLAAIFAFRMLGLFMILPVFSSSADEIRGASVALIGLALGIYGLTQACLQIPFGMLSDRFGRKPIIAFGLIIFAMGSIVAALSHSITGIIAGRALQGAGAIGSALLALVADLTRDENRSKAMAFIGLTIGFAFSIAMIFGPIIYAWFNLSGIFWLTSLLAGIGLILLFTTIPKPQNITHSNIELKTAYFKSVLKNPQLLRLNIGIFVMHAIMTATFIAIPVLLGQVLHFSETMQVLLYLIVLVIAFSGMLPLIIISEKQRKMKTIFLASIVTLIITQILLYFFHRSALGLTFILLLFFLAFTLLEANLPSLVSKIASIRVRGTAMGVYSTSQFLGIFVGGSVGGWIFEYYGLATVFIFCALLGIFWLLFASNMQQPPYLSTLTFPIQQVKQDLTQLNTFLNNFPGVAEVALIPDEELLYLKVDKKIFKEDELRKLMGQVNLD